MPEQLDTGRLELVPLVAGHLDLLVELDGDPEVMRYLDGGRPPDREQLARSIEHTLGSRWLARERTGDPHDDPHGSREAVGWFSLRPDAAGEYELGYRLRRAAWGRGLATEGARALLQRAFGKLGAERVWARTMAVNRRSRAVLERSGLHHVRTLHLVFEDPLPGTELGDVEYAVTRAQWTASAGPGVEEGPRAAAPRLPSARVRARKAR